MHDGVHRDAIDNYFSFSKRNEIYLQDFMLKKWPVLEKCFSRQCTDEGCGSGRNGNTGANLADAEDRFSCEELPEGCGRLDSLQSSILFCAKSFQESCLVYRGLTDAACSSVKHCNSILTVIIN